MSNVDLVEVFMDPSGPDIIEVMSPGPPGVPGPIGPPITIREADGSPTGPAIEVVFPNNSISSFSGGVATLGNLVSLTVLADALAPYATISSVNSALNTKLNTTGGAVSGLLSFTGLDSVGVRLKSLTAAQYGNLTPADGDIYLDTTTNRIDARVGGTTREVLDNFGGQQVNGNLAATTLMLGGSSGPLWRNSGGLIEARNNTNTARTSVLVDAIEVSNNVNCVQVIFGLGLGARLRNVSGTVEARTNDNTGFAPFACSNLTAFGTGTVTAVGTGTHTFGTTNLVTFTNGTIQTSDGNRTVNLDFNRTRYINTQSAYGLGTYLFDFSRAGPAELIVANTFGNGAGTQGAFPVAMRVEGSFRIGGGTAVANILSATATLDFPSIAANSFADLTITVTGAVSGDTVIANPIAGSAITDVSYDAWVSAANTVTIRATNNSSTTARDPASGTFRATVIRF